jgi:hypothetical protein
MKVVFIILLSGFMLVNFALAEDLIVGSQVPQATDGFKGAIRILISTSGPAEFESRWLNDPYRVEIVFKSRNVLASMDKEVLVNEGVIKRIISTYAGGQKKYLKTITFELSQKVPYRVWQENDSIVVDIQSLSAAAGSPITEKEIFATEAQGALVERIEAMDAAITQEKRAENPVEEESRPESIKDQKAVVSTASDITKTVPITRGKNKNSFAAVFWLSGAALTLLFGLRFLFRLKDNIFKSTDRTKDNRIRELEQELQKKGVVLDQEEIVRKTIEQTSLKREKEFKHLKSELEETDRLFGQETAVRKEKEMAVFKKDKELAQLKDSCESLKNVLISRGVAKELTGTDEKGKLWIDGKSPERRAPVRLPLTKDFDNTVILKVGLQDVPQSMKCFAENISAGGLCFSTSKEFDKKSPLNLRVLFYGGKVPNFKTQAWIIWTKAVGTINYYGVIFEGLSEKIRNELAHHIESKTEDRKQIPAKV